MDGIPIRGYCWGLYGLITPMLAALGLVSSVGGLIGSVLALPGYLLTFLRYLHVESIASFLIALIAIINVIFYAYMGCYYKKSSSKNGLFS